ncbi:hypothetical protein ACKWTF_016251 [Chironomus riparius]
MKQMLYNAIEAAPSAEIADPEVLTRYFAKFDEQFFNYCDSELTKINTFYSEKLAEATRKYAGLRSELSEAQNEGISMEKFQKARKNILQRKKKDVRKIQELKLAFSEFYLSLVLLQNYQNLNFTGFRKILKKHDKLLNIDFGAKWRQDHVELAHFYTNKDIDRLITETENVVTLEIEAGDRQKAMKRLRVPPLGEQQSPWTTFKVGLFSGAFVVLVVSVAIAALFKKPPEDTWRSALRLYRAPFLFIEFLFLWSLNVYGWRSCGVNHVLIFEINPRSHLSEQHIMELAAVFGVLWCISVLSFMFSSALSIPAYVNPLLLYIFMALFLLNPTKTFRHEARFWTVKILSRVICAPFFYVNFADFWIADQLNSIVPAFLDLQYFFCFYTTNGDWSKAENPQQCTESYVVRTIVAMLPAYFRMAQCLRRFRDTKEAFPHLANAAKYASSFFVVIFSSITMATTGSYPKSTHNPFFYFWIVSAIVSSCYAYGWDVYMDWGLMSMEGENKFLRDEIVYSNTWFYYIAMVEDFILRFGWTLSMSLIEMGYIDSDIMLSILAPLEVFRRFIWNYFRLENEHLNNCGNFRAVRDISIAPITGASDEAMILRMMDDDDGVTNRRNKKGGKKKDQRLMLNGIADSQDDLDMDNNVAPKTIIVTSTYKLLTAPIDHIKMLDNL